MDFLLPTLALVTLGIVLVLALVSKRRTEKKLDDPQSSHSSLARDTPDPQFTPDPGEFKPDPALGTPDRR